MSHRQPSWNAQRNIVLMAGYSLSSDESTLRWTVPWKLCQIIVIFRTTHIPQANITQQLWMSVDGNYEWMRTISYVTIMIYLIAHKSLVRSAMLNFYGPSFHELINNVKYDKNTQWRWRFHFHRSRRREKWLRFPDRINCQVFSRFIFVSL